jgi:hypothetical protein
VRGGGARRPRAAVGHRADGALQGAHLAADRAVGAHPAAHGEGVAVNDRARVHDHVAVDGDRVPGDLAVDVERSVGRGDRAGHASARGNGARSHGDLARGREGTAFGSLRTRSMRSRSRGVLSALGAAVAGAGVPGAGCVAVESATWAAWALARPTGVSASATSSAVERRDQRTLGPTPAGGRRRGPEPEDRDEDRRDEKRDRDRYADDAPRRQCVDGRLPEGVGQTRPKPVATAPRPRCAAMSETKSRLSSSCRARPR